jgi:hypothetical protein
MSEIFEKLQKAKDAVKYLLDHESGSVNFHDIIYWASEVVRLRKEIKEQL